MLRIADLEFDIISCKLEAYCQADRMQWDIQVEANSHPNNKLHGNQPNLSLSLFETPPETFQHWRELAPRKVNWIERIDTDITPSGMLYIFEHTPIFECHAHLYDDGSEMQIKLDGKCDVYFDSQYDTNLDLHLDSPVVFQCVWLGRRTEADCRKAISPFLNPDSLG